MSFDPEDKRLSVLVLGKSDYFEEYRDALAQAINSFGFIAEAAENLPAESTHDVVLIINPLHYVTEARRFNYDRTIYVAIQTEQVPTNNTAGRAFALPRLKQYFQVAHRYDIVFEWSRASYRALKKRLPHVQLFPHSSFDAILASKFVPSNNNEKYDVFFIGNLPGIRNRRIEMLDFIKTRYNMYPEHKDIWRDDKRKVLQLAKIALNIHYDDALTFECPRMFDYLGSARFVLSEKISDSYPLVAGKHYASFYPHEIVKKLDYYLSHPAERNKIAEAGYLRVKEFHMNNTIETLLQHVMSEVYNRKLKKYRVKSRLFHMTGISWFRDITTL